MMIRHLLLLVCLLIAVPGVGAAPLVVPAAPNFESKGYLLIDFDSDQVLAQKNADERFEPASITKIMTAYVVYEALRNGAIGEEDEVLVSEKAWRMYGSRMFIEVGKRVKLSDLLLGLIVQSGNDASIALAEHVAGTESAFVSMMNAQAEALGMTNTHYVNATGLPDPEHYTSARDIAKLTRRLISDFPEKYALYSNKQFTYNGIPQYNRNKLLWRDASVDGVKTGHTDSAGYCLVASAQRDDMRLISVVLGTQSENARAQNSQALLNYGFRFYETHKLYAAGESLIEARVWKGEVDNVPLGLAEDLYVTIPKGQYKELKANMELSMDVEAPVNKGAALGDVQVDLNGESVRSQSLVALQSVEKGGLWRRSVDSVLQWFD